MITFQKQFFRSQSLVFKKDWSLQILQQMERAETEQKMSQTLQKMSQKMFLQTQVLFILILYEAALNEHEYYLSKLGVILHLFQVEILGFVLFKLKEQYMYLSKTPLFAFDVLYQCRYVSNTGEEDSPHIKNLVFFSLKSQSFSPSTSPTQKI